jgi:hypothetical protein
MAEIVRAVGGAIADDAIAHVSDRRLSDLLRPSITGMIQVIWPHDGLGRRDPPLKRCD